MLQYDLTDSLVFSDSTMRSPTEGELLALQVALMLHADRALCELHDRSLRLSHDNVYAVRRLLTHSLSTLGRDIGDAFGLRRRLHQLIGLRISRGT